MLRILIILFSLITAVGLNAVAQAPAQPQRGAPPGKAPEDPPPAMSVPPSYKFDSRGRRDPFVNPVPKPRTPEPAVPVIRPDGLKGVLMSEAQITAVVVSKEAPELTRIMISAPGNKVYFGREGDALFDAVIKDIERDTVVFSVTMKEKDGRSTIRDVVRKIRPTP